MDDKGSRAGEAAYEQVVCWIDSASGRQSQGIVYYDRDLNPLTSDPAEGRALSMPSNVPVVDREALGDLLDH